MESLSRMEHINLPAIMIEHIQKIMTSRDEKHGLAYGYLLNRVFISNNIKLGTKVRSTIKQAISFHMLVECECVEGRSSTKGKPQVFELLDNQEQLKHEMEEISMLLVKKDTEIAHLKAQLAKASQDGPSSEEIFSLRTHNA